MMITSTAEPCSVCPQDILENGRKKSKMADQSRLASFFSYPYTSGVSALVLAEAGFHYEGRNDEVMCRQCGLRYSGWQKGDDPKCIHLKKSPNCPFFQSNEPEAGVYGNSPETGNMLRPDARRGPDEIVTERKNIKQQHTKSSTYTTLINFQENENIPAAATQVPKVENGFKLGQDVPDNAVHREDTVNSMTRSDVSNLRNENEALEHYSGTEDSAITTAPNETQSVEQIDQNNREVLFNTGHDSAGHSDTITIQTSTGSLETVSPKYQQFAILATRLTSYSHWPQHLKQRPEDLAKAGLFYEGTNDYVRCFHCAGGLREWDPEDDPFYEHARWFPFCPFMRLVKGDKYITGVQSGTIKPTDIQDNKLKLGQSKELNLYDHPAVLSVMAMGYTKTVLTKAITIYRKRHGMDLSAEKLLPFVWEITENGTTAVIPDEEVSEKEQTYDNKTEMRCESKSDVTELVTAAESTNKGIDELTEENRELREQKNCKVCFEEEASIVFLPCGHLVTCPLCASALRKCPVCRTYIRGTVKAIIS
ncbi:baculoviral IAP repeat-containing protein 7-like [Mizuhopecten yessoensis]|uniref:baculoviral IAP repeat-containing protein 7-like n=1 Tax=Mizuhopecten yessoensis TaxID=6573 RepID=UPI000B458C86|nr:baculoviral IAP repeat-containing protein 7-like [Mizuhopecten yessoensis]XP_021348811.1 baculoviral IAP repeat-containing protein 7-like [Mizuhopecten yessoensis]